jgi:hypothetical protein
VLIANPVIGLVKEPLATFSLVFEELIVGLAVVDQHTPLAVTVAPPFVVILPPLEAVVDVILVGVVVVTVGMLGDVVNVTSFPYAVPALFVA